MTYSPTVPGGGAASYKLRRMFTYNNGYWEVQDESGHIRKNRQIQSLIYNAGCSESLYYGV